MRVNFLTITKNKQKMKKVFFAIVASTLVFAACNNNSGANTDATPTDSTAVTQAAEETAPVVDTAAAAVDTAAAAQ